MSELGDLQDRSFATATAATNTSYPPERRLSAEQLASYLDRREYAVVGSARKDGRPHAAMSVYVRRGTTFWLPTMAGSVRERNVRRTPWLTLVIAEQDDSRHIAVIAEGPTEVIEPADVPQDVREALTADWVSSWIRVNAERLLSYADKDAAP
ncbi:MAG TPA: pyridoxamine 5'-phosphate oxidase family protein [Streptosporangiaceae bacterium]|jgi:general stress protein 26|nr:pyridoxamine 5'-phosphate oxidase family protein [Streptosporangiaceae bacterium]HXS64207.1 pyridoxamine 5'-phosphate oxidase family protein [Streptosporangiaceae bacterium]